MNSFHKTTAFVLVSALLLSVLGTTSEAKKKMPPPDPPDPPPVEYEITWLTHPDANIIRPLAINDEGTVVGYLGWTPGPQSEYRAFVAHPGTGVRILTTEANVPTGWEARTAEGIDNWDRVAGAVEDPEGIMFAAIFDLVEQTSVVLPLVGAGGHYAADINAAGEIVGYRIDPDEGYFTIVYTWNDDLGDYEGQEIGPGRALTINDSGEILMADCRIYDLVGGSWVPLDQLTACGDMNDAGVVAGRAVVRTKGSRQYEGAVRFSDLNGTEVLFDGRSNMELGSAINNAGQVLIDYTMSRDGLILYDDTHGALSLFDLVVGDPADVGLFLDGYGFLVRRGLSEPDATGFPKICGKMGVPGSGEGPSFDKHFTFVLTPSTQP